jgi:hypothetical protein
MKSPHLNVRLFVRHLPRTVRHDSLDASQPTRHGSAGCQWPRMRAWHLWAHSQLLYFERIQLFKFCMKLSKFAGILLFTNILYHRVELNFNGPSPIKIPTDLGSLLDCKFWRRWSPSIYLCSCARASPPSALLYHWSNCTAASYVRMLLPWPPTCSHAASKARTVGWWATTSCLPVDPLPIVKRTRSIGAGRSSGEA